MIRYTSSFYDALMLLCLPELSREESVLFCEDLATLRTVLYNEFYM